MCVSTPPEKATSRWLALKLVEKHVTVCDVLLVIHQSCRVNIKDMHWEVTIPKDKLII